MTLLLTLALLIAIAIGAVVYRINTKWYRRRMAMAVDYIIIAGLLGLEAAVLQTIVGRI